jgi:hypothetical protein
VVGVLVLALAPSARAGPRIEAAFTAPSGRPGEVAVLRIAASPTRSLTLEAIGAAAEQRTPAAAVPSPTAAPWAPRRLRLAGRAPWSVEVRLRWAPSGVYLARLTAPGVPSGYAPLVLRPRYLGARRTLVVEPTNTWQAYNVLGGDSWYVNENVMDVDLERPYAGDGLPPHFLGYDLGFLEWVAATHARADFVADRDLAAFTTARRLRRLYDLIVFPGHEEYVTRHVFRLVEGFRDLGGSLAFLSADSFFWRIEYSGTTMIGRWRFARIGLRPASLVGAAYDGWESHRYPNRPYVVVGARRLPWLFAGTGLVNGSRFGRYGIEIDARERYSPPGTVVAAEIRGDFGRGHSAQMTYYRRGAAQVFDAGVMNFGGSAAAWAADWTMLKNLWRHLGGSFGPPLRAAAAGGGPTPAPTPGPPVGRAGSGPPGSARAPGPGPRRFD